MNLPKHCAVPYAQLSERTKAVGQHDYCDAEGRLLWRIVRYAGGRGDSKERSFVPAERGGWWVCKPRSNLLPAVDQRVDRYPLYCLPKLLEAVQAGESREVWVMDGERSVDAVLGTIDPPAEGLPPCTCLYGRKYDFRGFDLEPLRGQRVLLLATADKASRDHMQRLAQELMRLDCRIRCASLPSDSDCGITETLAKSDWFSVRALLDESGVEDYVSLASKSARRRKSETAAKTRAGEVESPEAGIGAMPSLADTKYFRVLGHDKDGYIVLHLKRLKTLRHIKSVRPASRISTGALSTLVPDYEWWLKICAPGGTQKNLTSSMRAKIMAALERAAAEKGAFDVSTVRGLGANIEPDGSLAYNLGDRLLLRDGDVLNKEAGFDEASEDHVYISGSGQPIKLEDHPDAERWSREFYDGICGCHWESSQCARTFLGWVVAAVAGGALPFRPMLWLVGPHGSDAMFLTEEVLLQLVEVLTVHSYKMPGKEVGVPLSMGNDSLMLMLDELEPAVGRSRRRLQCAIFDMTRSHSLHQSCARLYRRRAEQPEPFLRFSAVCASAECPDSFGEDLSHFFFARLARERMSDWPAVRQALRKVLDPQRAAAIRTFIIRNIPAVVARAAALESELAARCNLTASEAQMSAALTAGAELLSGDATPVLRERPPRSSQCALLAHMLSTPVPVLGGKRLSLGDCLRHCAAGVRGHGRGYRHRQNGGYARIAGRYGFRLDWADDGHSVVQLRVAPGIKQMLHLLRGTEWENANLHEHFKHLPGVQSPRTNSGYPVRGSFAGVTASYMVLPSALLKEAGFCLEAASDSREIR